MKKIPHQSEMEMNGEEDKKRQFLLGELAEERY